MRLDLQSFLFEKKPTRLELLSYISVQQKEQYHVQVFRNHSFELIEHTIAAYLDYAEMNVRFSYSGYDDSFSFLELDETADLLILWIDANRYTKRPIQNFLKERLIYLRSKFTKSVLLISLGETVQIEQAGLFIWNLTDIQEELGGRFLDERAKDVSGTSLSRHAILRITEQLGLRYLPGLLRPPLKAVVTDLDNTLYAGVLGEDGAEKLVLTEGHNKLQKKLKKLSGQGMFLCIASKNNQEDVESLFSLRSDFPLRMEDFAFINASWKSKAQMLTELAEKMNIGMESILFIDDNIGELQTVAATFPTVKMIHALDDATLTERILDLFPGIMHGTAGKEDIVRKQDTQANQQRQILQSSLSKEEYIRSLRLNLVFDYDNKVQLIRIAELANKTNQFIFNYKRYTQTEIEQRLKADDYCVVSISLSDRLSDSGLIGVCVGRNMGDYIEIEECFISCRALGRGIEDVIVLGAIQGICSSFNNSHVHVSFQKGPRNIPADMFVQSYLSEYLEKPEAFSYSLPENLLKIRSINKRKVYEYGTKNY